MFDVSNGRSSPLKSVARNPRSRTPNTDDPASPPLPTRFGNIAAAAAVEGRLTLCNLLVQHIAVAAGVHSFFFMVLYVHW